MGRSMMTVDAMNPEVFKLAKGLSAETSGGLLVALKNQDTAQKFIAELKTLDKQDAWIVGRVTKTKEKQKLSKAVLVSGIFLFFFFLNFAVIYSIPKGYAVVEV